MNKEELHVQIRELLEKNGAMGVNALQKHLDVPLSSLQHYLDKQQSYFKKNERRHWVLPEQVTKTVEPDLGEKYSLILKSQLQSIEAQTDLLISSLKGVALLIKQQADKPAPVAEALTNEKLITLQKQTDQLPNIIKAKKENIPEELMPILLNTNWIDLFIDLGNNYVNSVIEPALYDLLSGKLDYLDEDVLTTIKEYSRD